jgi:hypothetical protein
MLFLLMLLLLQLIVNNSREGKLCLVLTWHRFLLLIGLAMSADLLEVCRAALLFSLHRIGSSMLLKPDRQDPSLLLPPPLVLATVCRPDVCIALTLPAVSGMSDSSLLISANRVLAACISSKTSAISASHLACSMLASCSFS